MLKLHFTRVQTHTIRYGWKQETPCKLQLCCMMVVVNLQTLLYISLDKCVPLYQVTRLIGYCSELSNSSPHPMKGEHWLRLQPRPNRFNILRLTKQAFWDWNTIVIQPRDRKLRQKKNSKSQNRDNDKTTRIVQSWRPWTARIIKYWAALVQYSHIMALNCYRDTWSTRPWEI